MPRYSDEIIEEVRQSNDIVDVISQYMTLKRSGRNYFGVCPFHNEKSPSFSVSPDKQIFHCFGCGVGGNVFTFLTKLEGISFIESVQTLAEKANITLPTMEGNIDAAKEILKSKVYKVNEFASNYYHENLYKPQSKAVQEYIKSRKLTNNTLKAFKLGFSGRYDELYRELVKQGFNEVEILESGLVNKNEKGQYIDRYRNRLMFPISDVRGRVIGFGGRVLDDSKPKYINSPENVVYSKGKHLYGLDVAKKHDTKKIIIVEGYMDVISLYQRGVTNAVASLGTAMTNPQGWLLRKISEQIVLSFDSDEAGTTAKLRALDILQSMGCDVRVINMEGAKDPDEYIIKYGNARFNHLVDSAISIVEFKVKILKSKLNLENVNDKIKFLTEIAGLIAKVSNTIEREVYIEKISDTYNISREAIYAEVNKLIYNTNKNEKTQENKKIVVQHKPKEYIVVSQSILKRENTIIALLLSGNLQVFKLVSEKIKPEDFKYNHNKEITKKLYDEFKKGNSNINGIVDNLSEEERNHITSIMAEDYEIKDLEKATVDILQLYRKEALGERKLEILQELEQEKNIEKKRLLEKELSEIIINLARVK